MVEEKIRELISDGEGAEKISFWIPKKLLDKILERGREKYGAIKERGLKTQAAMYFMARGVLDWEDQHREELHRKKHLPRHLGD